MCYFLLLATLVYKEKEEIGSGVAGPSGLGGKKGFNTKVPAGSPFRAKNGMTKSSQKANKMTFHEAIEKQKSAGHWLLIHQSRRFRQKY